MYRVFIVDDHESICDSLSSAFFQSKCFKVVGTIKNALHAELYSIKLKPDLILMDVCTEEGASGLSATKIIKEKHPNIKIIVMSGFDEITYAPRAKEVGADAFIYKSRNLKYFIKVSNDVMNGKQVFPEERVIRTPKGETPLTEKEMAVLRLMCKHMNNKEIADELFISEHTVKYHKSKMLLKTGFDKTLDLAFYMIINGYINPLY